MRIKFLILMFLGPLDFTFCETFNPSDHSITLGYGSKPIGGYSDEIYIKMPYLANKLQNISLLYNSRLVSKRKCFVDCGFGLNGNKYSIIYYTSSKTLPDYVPSFKYTNFNMGIQSCISIGTNVFENPKLKLSLSAGVNTSGIVFSKLRSEKSKYVSPHNNEETTVVMNFARNRSFYLCKYLDISLKVKKPRISFGIKYFSSPNNFDTSIEYEIYKNYSLRDNGMLTDTRWLLQCYIGYSLKQ